MFHHSALQQIFECLHTNGQIFQLLYYLLCGQKKRIKSLCLYPESARDVTILGVIHPALHNKYRFWPHIHLQWAIHVFLGSLYQDMKDQISSYKYIVNNYIDQIYRYKYVRQY